MRSDKFHEQQTRRGEAQRRKEGAGMAKPEEIRADQVKDGQIIRIGLMWNDKVLVGRVRSSGVPLIWDGTHVLVIEGFNWPLRPNAGDMVEIIDLETVKEQL